MLNQIEREKLQKLRWLRGEAESLNLSLNRRCRRCGATLTAPRSLLGETGPVCRRHIKREGGPTLAKESGTASNQLPLEK